MADKTKLKCDVAVVGGGFSGAMVAVHLGRIAPEARIWLFDRVGLFGRGVAYATDSAHHLLNVPAGKMSAFADEPDHFFAWLEDHRAEAAKLGLHEITRETFVPRRLYGLYITDMINLTKNAARGFETIETEIVDIDPADPDGRGFTLRDANGVTLRASKVVLALGNFAPGDPRTNDRTFHSNRRYLNPPWTPNVLKRISQTDEVVILGAGLTALDLLVGLVAQGACGTIHVVSRHGLFPQPHQACPPQPNWFSNSEFPRTIREIVRLLRWEVEAAARQGIDWRAIIDGLRPHTQRLWKSLSIEERKRFLRHVRPFWESHRHRAPSTVLSVKDEMIRRGQLKVHRARLMNVRETSDALYLTLFDRSGQKQTTIRGAFVINCTGPECNYYKLKDRLIVNLLARGLINPDPLFLGLGTAPNGAVLDYHGEASPNIFTLGSAKRGMLFETTAVPELRVQARQLAEELLPGCAR